MTNNTRIAWVKDRPTPSTPMVPITLDADGTEVSALEVAQLYFNSGANAAEIWKSVKQVKMKSQVNYR